MTSSAYASLASEIKDSEHWLSAMDLLPELDIRPGMTVADIGAGIASYALPIARRVGSAGSVFAVEWRPWMMEELHARLAGANVPANVRAVAGRAADTGLATASCDLVVLADIWHELEHHKVALDEARRILRRDGRLAILDWCPDALCPPGPPIEHRISRGKTICTLEMQSWSLVKAADLSDDGYLLLFEMSDESAQS
jgi:ubiquinone/menaquinone biosynthesis C-methylase UbiE